MDDKVKILIDKRISELKCLDIEPVLYYNICKYLERSIYTVVKDGSLFIFPKPDFAIPKRVGKANLKEEQIISNLSYVYGINNKLIERIFEEWKREKYIYAKMCDKALEYWDYIGLPIYGKESKDDGYNF